MRKTEPNVLPMSVEHRGEPASARGHYRSAGTLDGRVGDSR